MGIAFLAGVLALGWWLFREEDTPPSLSPIEDSSEGSSSPALGARTTEPGEKSPEDPFGGASGPLRTDGVVRGLRSRLEAVRWKTLDEILRAGTPPDAAVLAILAEMAAGPPGKIRAWAQAALMRVDGDRRFLRELAERAAESEDGGFYADLLRRVDPSAGGALLRAARVARERAGLPEPSPLPGLEEVIAALSSDPKAGAEAISRAVAAADRRDEPTWLDIAAAMRPLPEGVAAMLGERIRAGVPSDREAAVVYLLRKDVDLSAVPPALPAALAARLESKDDPLRGASIRALGRLGKVDERIIERIVRSASEGEQASFDALISLKNLGEQARPYARSMIELEPSLTEAGRFLLAQALLSVGGEGVGTYAARRILTSNDSERSTWLAGASALSRVPDAAAATAAVASLAAKGDDAHPEQTLPALARIDPAASQEATTDTLAAALADLRPERRVEAVKALSALATLPAKIADLLAPLARDGVPAVRDAAVGVIAAAWRFGPGAKPLVPVVLALLGAEGREAPTLETRVGLLRTLGAADPDGPEARAALLDSLTAEQPDERLAGLHGLSRVAKPTERERAAVAVAAKDPIERVSAFARSVRDLPAWR